VVLDIPSLLQTLLAGDTTMFSPYLSGISTEIGIKGEDFS